MKLHLQRCVVGGWRDSHVELLLLVLLQLLQLHLLLLHLHLHLLLGIHIGLDVAIVVIVWHIAAVLVVVLLRNTIWQIVQVVAAIVATAICAHTTCSCSSGSGVGAAAFAIIVRVAAPPDEIKISALDIHIFHLTFVLLPAPHIHHLLNRCCVRCRSGGRA